ASPATKVQVGEAQVAADALGVRLLVLNATSQSEIEAAFAALVQQRAGALLVTADVLFATPPDRLVTLAARYSVPAMYQFRESTAAGGLVSYGNYNPDSWRQVGVYAGRILRGEK